MLEELKEKVCQANLDLVKHGLVLFTWGNASAIDRNQRLVVIKPSGVSYSQMKSAEMVVVNLAGEVIEGRYKPSSDTATHLELYKAWPEIGGVVHTHSTYATAWAQTGYDIPIVGTTQADYFYGDIPCTRDMSVDEIDRAYELETGKVIIERFENLNPTEMPGVVVKNHGPFTWGRSIEEAVHNSAVMEEIAKMTYISSQINSKMTMNTHLTEKHYKRKHGKNAYYGQ
ncbi:L-ribulose-5-phosphate 4-epimerase [Reichenbachiella carrageenanivorans]|uniref:L-ribulose-5-phosphate 4-epimerase n=1 Tax=Reichenbachiella carrageenanivorans TaxID=2979869 RepID=A0ABY6D504_9BACT|nr:L-ribulose-5-phosphate 4-epimerase [Reichenbachiella carrageenanivorans]UXX80979.1 L-ribulose-5-phosphate 4-epimerase [Reichenbachiella carrageenanivorans]